MKFRILIQVFAIFFLILGSCSERRESEIPVETIKMKLNSDSSAIELINVPAHIKEEFISDSLDYSQWSNFFAVYEESKDPEMRDFQSALPGTYRVEKDKIIFRPDSVFGKGKFYFSRCYTKSLLRSPEDILSSGKLSAADSYIEFRFKMTDR